MLAPMLEAFAAVATAAMLWPKLMHLLGAGPILLRSRVAVSAHVGHFIKALVLTP